MMVKALLYGYCVGVASSRRIAQRLHEDIAFRVLAANNTPDFRTISDFRKDNLDALSGTVHTGTGVVPAGGAGEAGARGAGRHEGKANASRGLLRGYLKERRRCCARAHRIRRTDAPEAALAAEVADAARPRR